MMYYITMNRGIARDAHGPPDPVSRLVLAVVMHSTVATAPSSLARPVLPDTPHWPRRECDYSMVVAAVNL